MGKPAGCRICNRELSFHQQIAGQICDDWRCKWAILDREMTDYRQKAALACCINHPESYPMIVVPDEPVDWERLPQTRIQGHVAFLYELVVKTAGGKHQGETPAMARDVHHLNLPGMACQVCAVCQGVCCHLGKAHAFLDVATIRRFIGASGLHQPLEIVGAYIAHLPEKTAANACVYQSARGCTLPRWMRTDICNSYRCNGLRQAEAYIKRRDIDRLCVVARKDNRIRRAAFVDRDQIRHFPSSDHFTRLPPSAHASCAGS